MHSPEPWTVDESERCYEKYLDIVDSNGKSVIVVNGPDREEGSNIDGHPDDIHRIVACVNACRGIQTEDLQKVVDGKKHFEFADGAGRIRRELDLTASQPIANNQGGDL